MKATRVLVIAIAITLIALPVLAQPKTIGGRIVAQQVDRPRVSGLQLTPRVVGRQRLAPAADTAAEFESFVVETLDDGTRVVRGTSRLDDREDHSRYSWTADLNAGTYRVEKIPLTEEQIREMQPAAGREVRSNVEGIDDPPNYCEDPSPEMCNDQCSGNWTATVTNYDPIHLELTKTTVSGNWAIYGATTCHWRESYSGWCWANPETAAFTTWYVDSCLRYFSNVQGSFHNDDWLFDSLRTYAYSSVTIRRVDGLGTFIDWSSRFSGESSSLLYGWMDQSGSNTCF